MAAVEEITMLSEVKTILCDQGFDGIGSCVQILVNEAMRIERSQVLAAQPYERCEARKGYANGYKDKRVRSRVGELHLRVPQVRGDVQFYPSSLERGVRSERALKAAVAEMYVKGVSTRRVTKVVERLCGLSVSSADVSRATALLDEELEKWRTRPLGLVPHLILDARYEKVRIDGCVVSASLLVATGVLPTGHRTVLGVSVSLSEAEVHWREFLGQLLNRGLHGVQSVTTDDHAGLTKAIVAVLPGIKWQRCQFHLQQNAQAFVPKVAMREGVASDIRDIFNAPDHDEAMRLLGKTCDKYKKSASNLAKWMEENIPQGMTAFTMEKQLRKKLRTTNGVERVNKELARRTKVVGLFPNQESLLRLASAILMEISEEWETGRRYVKMD
jgi:transposase-like protein